MDSSFAALADRLAADIASGRLRPGDRLPPQRDFAHRAGIAVSTASRAYAELARRGLVVGEVGRGTFVRGAPTPADPALVEPTALPVDLELIFPMPPGTVEPLAEGVRGVLSPATLVDALRPMGAAGTAALREAAAAFLGRDGWVPGPEEMLFAANGRAAIAAALSALARPGDRIGVEAMTYPVVKGIAARLGLAIVPLPMDAEGARPEAAAAAHRSASLAAVYLQPGLHSPLGVSMGPSRRQAWAAVLEETGLVAVEDAVYGFLAPGGIPLAALAPARVVHVDSLSKRAAPGLSLGLLVVPATLRPRLAATLRAGAWSAGGFAAAVAAAWMSGGEAERVAAAKRLDAMARQAVAREALGPAGLQADPRAYHAWLPLPEPWRGESFAAAALRHGIAVTPGSAFAVGPGHAPAGVRLALAAPPLPVLQAALERLGALLAQEPGSEVE